MSRSTVRSLAIASLAVGAVALMTPRVAEAQSLRYGTTQPGNVIAIGNTLGLSKAPSENGPGKAGSIGTFLSLEPTSVDVVPANVANPWGAGTTNDWTTNGSSATLTLPDPESQVLYAELVWAGSYDYGGESVTPYLDTPVKLAFGNDAIQASPDASTSHTLDYVATGLGTNARYYSRSADVTQFVQDHASGVYAVSGVPATQVSTNDALDAAGWALVIAYRRDGDPTRSLSIVVGNDDLLVDVDSIADYPAYFCAPKTGSFGGNVVFAALEGDADKSGDQLLIADDPLGTFVTLSGPNNPANNFFASQIDDANGLLDTTGTFGTKNHDAATGANASGARQGWDVATVRLSSALGQLVPDQRTAVVRATTTGDAFLSVVAGVAVDSNAPRFSFVNSTATVSPTFPHPGDFVTITANLLNEGTETADGMRFSLELPGGASLVSFSTDGASGNVSHQPVVQADLTTGVDVGTIAPGATRTVTLDVLLGSSTTGSVPLSPVWSYAYAPCTGEPSLTETFHAKAATIAIQPIEATTSATTGAGGGGGGGAGGDDPIPSSGCGCEMTSTSTPRSALVALVMMAGLVVARRFARRLR